MPNAEDIAAQQKLLQAHRQTLHVLLTQQAQFGIAYTPPAVIHGIRTARAAIAEIKHNLGQWGIQETDLPDDAESNQASAGAVITPFPGIPAAGGDVIMANIGAGAQGVAVGKNIQQTIGTSASATDDALELDRLLGQLEREVGANQIDPATQAMANFQVRLLAGELRKADASSVPSASTITQVVDGLLASIPVLKPLLSSLFNAPAVLRILQRADAPLESWRQQRFDSE